MMKNKNLHGPIQLNINFAGFNHMKFCYSEDKVSDYFVLQTLAKISFILFKPWTYFFS